MKASPSGASGAPHRSQEVFSSRPTASVRQWCGVADDVDVGALSGLCEPTANGKGAGVDPRQEDRSRFDGAVVTGEVNIVADRLIAEFAEDDRHRRAGERAQLK